MTTLEVLDDWTPDVYDVATVDIAQRYPDGIAQRYPDGMGAHVAGWLLGQRSIHTRKAYRRDLQRWALWCAGHDVDVYAAQRPHVDAWVRNLEHDGHPPASINRYLAGVSSFYRYLVLDLEVLDRNPCARVRTVPRDPNAAHRYDYLSLDQLRAIGAAAAADGYRSELTFRLLFCNGLRVGEACGIRASDVHTRPDGVRYAVILGKGGRRRPTVLDGRTAELYVRIVGAVRESTLDDMHLCPHVRTVQDACKRWARTAGIDGPVPPHALRHQAITHLLGAGVPLTRVQEFAGHADPKVTVGYNRDAHALDDHPARTLTHLYDNV